MKYLILLILLIVVNTAKSQYINIHTEKYYEIDSSYYPILESNIDFEFKKYNISINYWSGIDYLNYPYVTSYINRGNFTIYYGIYQPEYIWTPRYVLEFNLIIRKIPKKIKKIEI